MKRYQSKVLVLAVLALFASVAPLKRGYAEEGTSTATYYMLNPSSSFGILFLLEIALRHPEIAERLDLDVDLSAIPSTPIVSSCATNADCAEWEECVARSCECTTLLTDGTCLGAPASGDDPTTTCENDSDCAEGKTCKEISPGLKSCECPEGDEVCLTGGDTGDGLFPPTVDPDAVGTFDPYADGSAGKGGGACSLLATAVPSSGTLFGFFLFLGLSLALQVCRNRR